MRLGSPKCSFALTLLCFASLTSPVFTQIAGDNVNMVSGTKWPGGDPFLQRQNEPSLAVSTRNPLHLLAGANDYRTVDLNLADSLPTGQIGAGDAWLGVFKSFDGGRTWQSTLLPGFPQDRSPEGIFTPLRLFKTASDPTVRAGTNGMFYYGGIAFNRDTQQGEVFVARFIDLDNKENGDATQSQDPIRYLGAVPVELNIGPDRGEAEDHDGGFLDKPALATDIPRVGAGYCRILARQSDGSFVTQTFPAGNVYMVYSVFGNTKQGPDTVSQIVFRRSRDCGASWEMQRVLSTGPEGGSLNQGASVAIDPQTGTINVAWRTFKYSNQPDGIVYTRSTDAGLHFTKPVRIVSLPAFDPKNPAAASFFDQNTSSTEFRSNAFPTIAVDDTGTPGVAGRVYVAWSQRGVGPEGDARIVLSSSNDGSSWSSALPVDNRTLTDDSGGSFSRGHQLMPQMTFNAGKLLLTYYDLRYDHTIAKYNPYSPFVPDTRGDFYRETMDVVAEPGSASPVFGPFVDDAQLSARRHTIDVMMAQSDGGASPSFSYGKISQYKIGLRGDQYETEPQDLQSNPPNLPLFAQGTAPFLGDYIDIAGQAFIPAANGSWRYNNPASGGAPSTSAVHYAVWTSDQDVRAPQDGNWKNYTPVGSGGGRSSIYDPTQTVPNCTPGQEGMRNQNIYSSRITQGLMLSSPQNSKPLSTSLQRGFVVLVQNFTNFQKSFRLSISAPAGVFASFQQILPNPTAPPASFPAAAVTLDVTVAPHSGASRTLFAMLKSGSAGASATITVNAVEIDAPGPAAQQISGGLSSFTLLNPESGIPALVGADGASASPSSAEIYDAAISAPNVTNPNVTNPNVTNPNVTNPNVTNPNVTNPNVTNPDLANPNVTNPNVTNSDVLNPNVTNPNVTNGNIGETPVADATYVVRNTGNTTASYRLRLAGQPSVPLQLLLNKTYLTPVGVNCQLMEESQQTLQANITNPNFESPSSFSDPNVTNPNVTNATLALAPGETALVTLRGNVCTSSDAACMSKHPDLPTMDQIVTQQVAPVAQAQAVNTTNTTATAPPVTAPPIPVIATAVFPDVIAGTSGYSVQLQAVGGTTPYTWSVANLPPGFSVNPGTGLFANVTPASNMPGTYTVTAQLTDAAGKAAMRPFALHVTAPLTVTSAGSTTAYLNSPFTFGNTAQGGTPPYTWTLQAGAALPPGLALAADGTITGTPTTSGNYSPKLQVVDSGTPAQTAISQLNIAVTSSYNPVADFSANANPSGVWTYGYEDTFGSPFTAFPAGSGYQLCNPPNCQVIIGPRGTNMGMHPGPFAQYAVLRFTAPSTGSYRVTGFFEGGDPHPTSTDTHIVVNGSAIFGANINSYLVPSNFDQTVALNPGNTIDFLVGDGGNDIFFDTTFLGLTITPVPPPTLIGASISPSNPTVAPGGYQLPLSVVANYSDGSSTQVCANWASSNTQVLSFPNGTNNSLAVSGNAGTATITATPCLNSGPPTTTVATVKAPPAGYFTITGSTTVARYRHTATLLNNGEVLVAGGYNYPSNVLQASAEIYDPATGAFTPVVNSMNMTRSEASAIRLRDGRVLITGGVTMTPGASQGFITPSAEIYDPASGVFSAAGNMIYGRASHASFLLPNGKVLIVGGTTSTQAAELYDPATGMFTLTGNMLALHGYKFAAAQLGDGSVLVAGGGDAQGNSTTAADLYDPVSATFTAVGPMSVPRLEHSATLLGNGMVLIAGGASGTSSSPNPLQSAELFDPSTRLFRATGNLVVQYMFQHHSIELANGNGLVLGGFGPHGTSDAPEMFDYKTETFSEAAPLHQSHQEYSITPLGDGTALISAGMVAYSEIYHPGQ